MKDSI